MWFRSALEPQHARPARAQARRVQPAPGPRLRFEALEDRSVPSFSPGVDFPVGVNPQAVVSADFNGDGRLDLATANSGDDSVSVLLGNGNGTFQAVRTFGTGPRPNSLAAGDFNGDGRLDLASANGEATISVLLGNGDGTFGASSDMYIGSYPSSLAAGNLDGDGVTDLVVTSNLMVNVEASQGYVNVLLGRGDGTFAPPLTTDGSSWADAVALADVNSDGSPDIVARIQYGYDQLYLVLLGNGDGTFQAATAFQSSTGFPVRASIAVADFDGDGKADFAAGSDGGGVDILAGNGDGTFGVPRSIYAGTTTWSIAVADFDGDGKPDLAGPATFLLGNGDGTFQPPTLYNPGSGVAVTAADFNGDGLPDLAVTNDSSNTVAVFINAANWPPPGAPPITVTDATATEGHTGTRAMSFTVRLSAAFGQTVIVQYSTADGTATAGSDYVVNTGALTFAPGETSKTINVLVNGDRLGEANETIVVNLSSPTNATIADGQGQGTILDDEPRISIGDVTKQEGKKGQTTLFTFTVTLSAAYDQAVTMSFRTANGTAKSGEDYVAKTGTLIFAPGETTKTITIEVKGDNKREADETFYLDLFGNSGNSLYAKSRGLGTILNDD